MKTRTRNRKNRIQNKDSVYENAKVFRKGLEYVIIVHMINDDHFITIIRYISLNKFLECCCTIWRSADKESELHR